MKRTLKASAFLMIAVLMLIACNPAADVKLHTVVFNTNGGGEIAPVKVVDGRTLARPEHDPVREGYAFKGWQLDGLDYDFSAAVTKDIELKAIWEHNHDWKIADTIDATCTETGTATYSCSCGETKTEVLAALGHDWKPVSVVRQPTCTEDGLQNAACSRCDETKDSSAIPATGHNPGDLVIGSGEYSGKHYRICSACNEKLDLADHEYSIPCADADKHWSECVCGAKSGEKAHAWGAPREKDPADASVHTKTCTECGKSVEEAHSYTAQHHDGSSHWNECICGAKGSAESHIWTARQNPADVSSHIKTCAECGESVEEAHSYTIQKYDESNHWNECACGLKSDARSHSLKYTSNSSKHWKECSDCAYTTAKEMHTYGDWEHDESKHWQICTVCSYNSSRFSHNFYGVQSKAPTETEAGEAALTCMPCGFEKISPIKAGSSGSAGGYIINISTSSSSDWQYLEVAPADLRVIDGMPTVDSSASGYDTAEQKFVFGYYRPSGSNEITGANSKYYGREKTKILVEKMKDSAYTQSSGDETTSMYAAKLCDDLEYKTGEKTFADWFLPSGNDLSNLYNRIYKTGVDTSYMDTEEYWSSDEANNVLASRLCIINGNVIQTGRENLFRIRPARVF